MCSNIPSVTRLTAVIFATNLFCAVGSAEPLRIGYPSGMNGQIIVTMEKAKLAESSGLDVTYSSFQYGPPMMEAFASGSLDAIVTSLMPVTSYASRLPGEIKVVAMLGQSSYSLMVAKDGLIKTPAELAGHTLGVSFGSDSHLDSLIWIDQQGLKGKVDLVNVAPSDLVTSLANKSVDAIILRQPQVQRLQDADGSKILHTWPFRFLTIMKTKFVESHPKEVEQYVAALRASILYTAQHKQQAAEWFGAELRVNPAIMLKIYSEDPNSNATEVSQIQVAVGAGAQQIIKAWTENAYKYKMIRQEVNASRLLLEGGQIEKLP